MKTIIALNEKDIKLVKKLNTINNYCLTDDQLSVLIADHHRARIAGDAYEMCLIEYRLTDINFHSECAMLAKGEYDELGGNVSQGPIIGKIQYLGFDGDVGEVMEYTDIKKYLEAIKKELYYNPDGFRACTLSKDSELRKSVDDLYYSAYGADNPNTIEHYESDCHRNSR